MADAWGRLTGEPGVALGFPEPLQIAHRYSGILTHTIEGTAYWIKQLLNAPEFALATRRERRRTG